MWKWIDSFGKSRAKFKAHQAKKKKKRAKKGKRTLRVEELGELGGDLAGSSGSTPPFSTWLSGIDVDSFSSAISLL